MVLHVRFDSLYISLPSSAKQQRQMTKFTSVQDGAVFERGPKNVQFFNVNAYVFTFYIDVFVVFVFVYCYVNLNSGKVGRNSRREATEGYSPSE